MTIKNGDDVLATNYTTRSIAKNYVKAYTHSNSSATVDGSSYFQNMYVFFTAPESGKVTLTLSKEAGKGDSYFDDVRVVENDSHNITTNKKGEVVDLSRISRQMYREFIHLLLVESKVLKITEFIYLKDMTSIRRLDGM